MFELCDNLVGIYKCRNCTKCVTIEPRVSDNTNNSEQIVATPTTNLSQNDPAPEEENHETNEENMECD